MGKEKTTTIQNTTQKATPSAQEEEFLRLQNEAQRATQPQLIETQKRGLGLISQILSGQAPTEGFFGDIGRGINPDITREISQEAIADLLPSFQSSGILDSGVAAEISGRVAGDVRRAAEEFNIGAKQNLLNLALSGQAQVQAPVLQQTAQLGGQLAGLRSVNTQGVGTTLGMNPFLKSFQQGAGSSFGKATGAAAGGFLF